MQSMCSSTQTSPALTDSAVALQEHSMHSMDVLATCPLGRAEGLATHASSAQEHQHKGCDGGDGGASCETEARSGAGAH